SYRFSTTNTIILITIITTISAINHTGILKVTCNRSDAFSPSSGLFAIKSLSCFDEFSISGRFK
ncbi:hypothetical protein K4G81_21700, partial [Mycobacterium tuberculosis]|nr:hypothetical protein [Mycobacterium tuberculosis]